MFASKQRRELIENNDNRSSFKKYLKFTLFFLFSLVVMVAGLILFSYFKQWDDLHGSAVNDLQGVRSMHGRVSGDVFADVNKEHENAYAIAYLKSRGVIRGYQDDTFKPDELINRAEFLKLISTVYHVYPHHLRYNNCFDDVHNEWFAPYVCFAKEKEWVQGAEDNLFYPDRNIKGSEALKILTVALDVDDISLHGAAEDVGDPWYASYLSLAEKREWLDLKEDSSWFNPESELTRASVSELLFRMVIRELPVV